MPAKMNARRLLSCFVALLPILATPRAIAADDRIDLFGLSIEELGKVVVTGTRIPGTDVAVPMTSVTREEIEKAGFLDLQGVFESLPQNFDEVTPDGRFANEGGSLLRGLNNTRVTAANLRGLGAESTLTLVNGSRRAGSIQGRVVDLSAIPLAFIDRVEVVTGGRSAVYGADAVAGVVNLVTRRDFTGAESQVHFGSAFDGGGERLHLSQLFGTALGRGHLVAGYAFARSLPLDLADVGLLSLAENPEIGLTQLSLNAQADGRRHSGYLSGRYELTDRIELYGEGLYTDREFEDFELRRFSGATRDSFTDTTSPSEHLALTAGARTELGGDWTLDVAVDASEVDTERDTALFIDLGFTTIDTAFVTSNEAAVSSVSTVLDGPLPEFAGVTARAAAGLEWRREEFESVFDGVVDENADRTVRSAFAELSIPLWTANRSDPRQLQLSLAGRYDDYSDFGGTFNPQIGLIWTPLQGLTFRGAYSAAFRAPALAELESTTEAFLELASDPAQGGAPVPVLFIQGAHPALGPEEADTWSFGVDFQPEFASWANVALSYFEIEYDGRIEQASINADRDLVLEREGRFPGLLTRSPSAAAAAAFLAADTDGFIDNDTGTAFDPGVQDILAVFPDLVLFDNRVGNLAIEEASGFDFKASGEFDTEAGAFSFGLNLTHMLDHERRVTAASPAFGLIDEVGKPADTRVRASGGWTRDAYGAFVYLNYVNDYGNPFSTPASRIGSWTTVDLSLRLQASELVDAGLFEGVEATLTVDNLFDNDPPRFGNSLQGVLYDPTNADPFGRYISLHVIKRW
jgi:iron complex outermembrane recepter protein